MLILAVAMFIIATIFLAILIAFAASEEAGVLIIGLFIAMFTALGIASFDEHKDNEILHKNLSEWGDVKNVGWNSDKDVGTVTFWDGRKCEYANNNFRFVVTADSCKKESDPPKTVVAEPIPAKPAK